MTELNQTEVKKIPQIRPWHRFFARSLDLSIISILFALISAYLIRHDIMAVELGPFVLPFTTVLMMLVEIVLLSTWGYTPGKYLLKIRVLNAEGTKPTLKEAAIRSASLFLLGEGAGLTFINPVTEILSYFRLLKTGGTYWDVLAKTHIKHEEKAAFEILLIALFVSYGIYFVILYLNPAVFGVLFPPVPAG
jgi:uncharacterized RDD family membrane protein YckC